MAMNRMGRMLASAGIAGLLGTSLATQAAAGPVFLTGHDPDFHALGSVGAQNLLQAGLDFVTGGTTNSTTEKFLWVQSRIAVPGGHRDGIIAGLGVLGLVEGTHFDVATAADLPTVDFSAYTAIGVASSFGGLLTRAELDGLIARSADIEAFINAGGGLFASSECFPCGANLLAGATNPDLFGYLPVDVTSIGASPPFTVTTFGNTTFGLVDSDLNDPTHNSFGLVGGLNIVDNDAAGNAVTLAGVVTIDGGFIPVPEPAALMIFAWGLLGLGLLTRRRRTA